MANYTVGLDLGHARDFSAVVVVEWLLAREHEECHVVHLERFDLGTPYPAVVDRVGVLLEAPNLRRCTELVIDGTGVGRAVTDLFRDAFRQGHLGHYWPRPMRITGGREVNGLTSPSASSSLGCRRCSRRTGSRSRAQTTTRLRSRSRPLGGGGWKSEGAPIPWPRTS